MRICAEERAGVSRGEQPVCRQQAGQMIEDNSSRAFGNSFGAAEWQVEFAVEGYRQDVLIVAQRLCNLQPQRRLRCYGSGVADPLQLQDAQARSRSPRGDQLEGQ